LRRLPPLAIGPLCVQNAPGWPNRVRLPGGWTHVAHGATKQAPALLDELPPVGLGVGCMEPSDSPIAWRGLAGARGRGNSPPKSNVSSPIQAQFWTPSRLGSQRHHLRRSRPNEDSFLALKIPKRLEKVFQLRLVMEPPKCFSS
jgi:hypothetical protein